MFRIRGSWMIQHVNTLMSTQDAVRDLERAGSPHGTAVSADIQTGGRGRFTRPFHSPAGGLYLSVLLREGLSPETAPLLTPLAAVAVIRILPESFQVSAAVKWPNDVWLNGLKLCGIIGESVSESGRLRGLVVGIGINVNTRKLPDDLSATSLFLAGGVALNIPSMTQDLHGALLSLSRDAERKRLGAWISEYRARCLWIGQPVTLFTGGDLTKGTPAKILGVGANLALQVQYSNGDKADLTVGEITVRPVTP